MPSQSSGLETRLSVCNGYYRFSKHLDHRDIYSAVKLKASPVYFCKLMKSRFKLVAFDLDGTLTRTISVWEYLHRRFGTIDKARVNADLFFQGKISYEEWAKLDTNLWRGISLEYVMDALMEVEYMDGADYVVEVLRRAGVKTLIISAGLQELADLAARRLGVDYALANKLVVVDGILTGDIEVRVGINGKGRILKFFMNLEGIPRSSTAAVGDDISDISLFEEAGFKIAFNPKVEAIRRIADVVVESDSLKAILPYLIDP
ncbi:MAG: HAD family phosphatase [Candidatus Bathyarchaeia archaeon]